MFKVIQRHWRCSDIVNFEHISHLVLVFLLLSWGETKKTNQKCEVFNQVFVFRHLFLSCFSTNETPEKLANFFCLDQRHFC